MRRKSIIIGIIIVIIALICIYLLIRPKALGNINHSYSKETTTISNISFLGTTGDKIKFSFRSNIVSGDLDIILYDSKGNEVYKLDKAKALETFFNLNNSDTYTLAAKCRSFIGKYTVKVYKAK